MKLTIQDKILPGAVLFGENPQPRFRALAQNIPCQQDGSLSPELLNGYGVACGERTLPYRMQDRYTREEQPVSLQTAVLENEHLRATFAPTYGGKLWSLFDKDENRELLFSNSVLRPANLAIRNAWTCGGIEWNLGHTGHFAFTCQSLHCARMTDPHGNEFLRMYEYEATEGLVMQLDFHLPSGSRQLIAHVRLENPKETDAPLYWWTNTAVPLTPQTRVFSSTDQILFQLPQEQARPRVAFGLGRMPHQPNLPDVDISYPWRIPFSVEYFFQNPREGLLPWEVSIEGDGRGFGERSTLPLFARKMFCWGSGTGGRNWCDYLSRPGEGDYIEIQAGLAPTQHHTGILPAKSVVAFTQLFGAFTAPASACTGDWLAEQPQVAKAMERTISAACVAQAHALGEACATLETRPLFTTGSAYGGLECQRRAKNGEPPLTPHLHFPLPDETSDAYPWLRLLQGEDFPASAVPFAYVTDAAWLPIAKAVLAQSDRPVSQFHYAVLLAECGQVDEACRLLHDLSAGGFPFATYALGSLFRRAGNAQAARDSFVAAYAQEQGLVDPSFAEGALEALVDGGAYAAAWALFSDIPARRRTPVMDLLVAKAAVALEQFDFLEQAFATEYPCIREGAAGLADVWLEYQARLRCRREGIPFSPEQIDSTLPLPKQLNFRMFE